MAKHQAQQVVCFNNVRQQYLIQVTYAVNNDDKFAPRKGDFEPHWVYSNQAPGSGYIHELFKDDYVTDN